MIERKNRISRMLIREISLILQSEVDEDWADFVTVRHVDMTSDLGIARVYFVLSCPDSEKKNICDTLNNYSPIIRKALAGRIKMKYLPELSFRLDTFDQYESNIDSIFEKIKLEKRNNENNP